MKKVNNERFIFGATAATIINLGLIVGLSTSPNPKLSIVSSILVIALADNLTDSLGIHIYQEAQGEKKKSVWISTFSNFAIRLAISLVFIFFILFFSLPLATILSITFGLTALVAISSLVAEQQKVNAFRAIAEHLLLALAVILTSNFLGQWIISRLE